MATATTTTSYCFRCQHYPGLDEQPLRRCGKCRTRRYCSQECQRTDWPTHKQECSTLAEGGGRQRQERMTFRLAGFPGSEPTVADPDTVYYIKTSKPHLKDVTIAGPYYPLQNIFPQLIRRLRREGSVAGERTIDEIVHSGDQAVLSLQHFNAPLPDGNVMKFELLREKNARVAHSLPGDVWTILIGTTHSDTEIPDPPARTPVDDMEVRGSFASKDEANTAAEGVLQDLKAEMGPDSFVHRMEMGGLATGCVGRSGTTKLKMLEVKHHTVEYFDWSAAQGAENGADR